MASQGACRTRTHLAELPALLGELYGLLGAVNELHGDAHHRLQLFGRVPHQQHLRCAWVWAVGVEATMGVGDQVRVQLSC